MTHKYVKITPQVSELLSNSGLQASFGDGVLELDNNLDHDDARCAVIWKADFVKLHTILGELIQVLDLKDEG